VVALYLENGGVLNGRPRLGPVDVVTIFHETGVASTDSPSVSATDVSVVSEPSTSTASTR